MTARALYTRIGGDSVELDTITAPLWWHLRGLSYTASGYGRRIPTPYMVRLPGSPRWRRVYCAIYSNSGTCYVDGPADGSKRRPWIVISD